MMIVSFESHRMTKKFSHLDVSSRLSASTALACTAGSAGAEGSGAGAVFVTSILLRTVVVFDVVGTSSDEGDAGGGGVFLIVVLRWDHCNSDYKRETRGK